MDDMIKLPQRCKHTALLNEEGLLTCTCPKPRWEVVLDKKLWKQNALKWKEKAICHHWKDVAEADEFLCEECVPIYRPESYSPDTDENIRYDKNIHYYVTGPAYCSMFSRRWGTLTEPSTVPIDTQMFFENTELETFELEKAEKGMCYWRIYVDLDKEYDSSIYGKDYYGAGTSEEPYTKDVSYIGGLASPPPGYSVSGMLIVVSGKLESIGFSLTVDPLTSGWDNVWYDMDKCMLNNESAQAFYFANVVNANWSNNKALFVFTNLAESVISAGSLIIREVCNKSILNISSSSSWCYARGVFKDCESSTFNNTYAISEYSQDRDEPLRNSLFFIDCTGIEIYGGYVFLSNSSISSAIPPKCLYLARNTQNKMYRRLVDNITYEQADIYAMNICCVSQDEAFWTLFFEEFCAKGPMIDIGGFLYNHIMTFPDTITTISDSNYSYDADLDDPFGDIFYDIVVGDTVKDIAIDSGLYLLKCVIEFEHIYTGKVTDNPEIGIYGEGSTITVHSSVVADDGSNDISFRGWYSVPDSERYSSISWGLRRLPVIHIPGAENNINIVQESYIGSNSSGTGNYIIGYTPYRFSEPSARYDEAGGLVDDDTDVDAVDLTVGSVVPYANTLGYRRISARNNAINLQLTLKDYIEFPKASNSYINRIPQPFIFYNIDPFNLWRIEINTASAAIKVPKISKNTVSADKDYPSAGTYTDLLRKWRSESYVCCKEPNNGQTDSCKDAAGQFKC